MRRSALWMTELNWAPRWSGGGGGPQVKTSRRRRGWKDGKEHTFSSTNVSFCHIMMITFVILTRVTHLEAGMRT